MDILDQIKDLTVKLNKYRDFYYNKNESLISDKEYDYLFDKLRHLESQANFVMTNSPTQTVGYTVASKLKKVVHDHNLLSLNKTTNSEEFIKYFADKDILLMAKMDGLTCSATYENGKLVRLETRGNGEIGEDVTHNAIAFENLPLTINYKNKIVVDGEAIITYKDFEEINQVEEIKFKNPRNLASGSVRQFDSSIASKRHLKFIAWKLYYIDESYKLYHNKYIDTFNSARLASLNELGFSTVPYVIISNCDSNSFESNVKFLKLCCEKLSYPIDGLVGMFNDAEYCNSLGYTSHHPKHSLAFKFYQEDNETTLLDIEWSTSRTGLVNPVAIFEPVEIDGTTVTRASLCNVSIIKELELGIGDTITVIKANQIIPKVTQNLTRSNTYVLPTICPSCGSIVEIKNNNGREMLYCNNRDCSAKSHDRFVNFVSKAGMDIEGLSNERLSQFIDNGLITDFCSLYTLKNKYDDLVKLDRFGENIIASILDAIEISKNRPFANVLVAIGIPNIGRASAANIIEECKSINSEEFVKNPLEFFINMCCSEYNWARARDIGFTTSNYINTYVKRHLSEFRGLSHILNSTISNDFNSSSILNKKTFCITGKLNHYSNRDALVAEIEKNGGISVSSVTAKTDYLINNDIESNSSKNQKAKKLGIKIITEEQFTKMITL